MAPEKRKGNVADGATAQKRARVGAEDLKKNNKKPKTNDADDSNSAPKATDLSVLRDDEPAFPRGGAGVLTPLEKKQIQMEATRDVLFEQKGPKKSSGDGEDDDGDDDEDADMDGKADGTTTAKKPRKQRKSKVKKKAEKEASETKGVRVEGLNFKVRLQILNWH